MTFSRRKFLGALAVAPALQAAGQNLKVGCQANGWPLREGDFDQLLDVLHQMREFGYTGFECNIRFVKGQFRNAAEAKRKIEATGVRYIGAHTSLEQAPAPEQIAGVAALGAERLIVSAKGLAEDGHFESEALANKAGRIEALAKPCHEQGVKFAYHNHNPEFANSNAEIDGLARATNPALVDFLVDAGHAHLGGGDPAKFLTQHAARVFGFHLKTYHGKEQQVPLGQGDFGFEKLAAAIRQTNWSGWLITEEGGGPRPGNTAAVKPDREYIRKTFGA